MRNNGQVIQLSNWLNRNADRSFELVLPKLPSFPPFNLYLFCLLWIFRVKRNGVFNEWGREAARSLGDEMLGWLIVASYRFNEVLISALFASVRLFGWHSVPRT